jgi:hypothetical protein
MYKGHHRGLFAIQKFCRLSFNEGLAPGLVSAYHLCSVAAPHLHKSLAEKAGHKYGQLLAGIHEIGHRRFHASRAGAGKRERHPVDCAEYLPQTCAHTIVDLECVWIQIAHHGAAQRRIDAVLNLGGAGSKQESL